jgi:hypothetical protein
MYRAKILLGRYDATIVWLADTKISQELSISIFRAGAVSSES